MKKENREIVNKETKIELTKLAHKNAQLKKLEEGVYHDGEKILYDTPPDTKWDLCCISGDKDVCVFLFKCVVMSSVLGFCMIMLMNGNQDGFYVSTLSLILGGVMGGSEGTKKQEPLNKNK